MSNFTTVKLIFPFVFLFCFTFFTFHKNSAAANKYVVQIAASKTPLDKKKITTKNEISEPGNDSEIQAFIRYFINYEETTVITSVLIEKTTLTNTFAQVFDEDSTRIDSSQKDKNSLILKENSQIPDPSELIQQKPEFEEIRNEGKEAGGKSKTHFSTKNIIHIIYSDDKLKEFKNDLINYGNNHIPHYLRKVYFIIVDIIFQFPAIILLIILILFFIINIITVLLVLNYTVKKKNQRERYVKIMAECMRKHCYRIFLVKLPGKLLW